MSITFGTPRRHCIAYSTTHLIDRIHIGACGNQHPAHFHVAVLGSKVERSVVILQVEKSGGSGDVLKSWGTGLVSATSTSSILNMYIEKYVF